MVSIIPKPWKVTEKKTCTAIPENAGAVFAPELEGEKELFLALTGHFSGDGEPGVSVMLDESLAQEEYALSVTDGAVQIRASGAPGVLYAAQSLRQMIHACEKKDGGLLLPECDILDRPRYAYRSIELDEARHFFGMDTVKRLLDLMFLLKINVFHWHLTDDQGWRIEIKKYPLLTQVGAWRRDSAVGGWNRFATEGKPHGGFYTQEQIREIVAYAARRNITVVPEIDMPAHFAAAFAAYPHLACREIPCEVQWHFAGKTPLLAGLPKNWNRSACVGKDSTLEFVYGVLEEVFALFPAPYFHIGGDEAPKEEWKHCPHCQRRMQEENLDSVEELQGWFSNRINDFAEQHGKRLIVWNEALAAQGLDRSIIGQYWTPEWDKHVNPHLEKGGELIVCKHQACYFDMCYAQYPLWNTYQFDPVNRLVPKQYAGQILGLEGLLWTEWVSSVEKMDLQLFPRMLALAEIAWTEAENKDFDDFLNRMHQCEKLLDELGVNYARDEIALPRGRMRRSRLVHRWYHIEQDWELRKNEEWKAKEKQSAEK